MESKCNLYIIGILLIILYSLLYDFVYFYQCSRQWSGFFIHNPRIHTALCSHSCHVFFLWPRAMFHRHFSSWQRIPVVTNELLCTYHEAQVASHSKILWKIPGSWFSGMYFVLAPSGSTSNLFLAWGRTALQRSWGTCLYVCRVSASYTELPHLFIPHSWFRHGSDCGRD